MLPTAAGKAARSGGTGSALPVWRPRTPSDRFRLPDGQWLTLRFVQRGDIQSLLGYLRSLARRTRYNRFLGVRHDLPEAEIERIANSGQANQFAVIGELWIEGVERIVCEARYAFDPETAEFEFGLSVGDLWQHRGIGAALLSNLECRAAALGARLLFGDTLQDNGEMQGLARKCGYSFTHTPDDWKLVRIQKPVAAAVANLPCMRWRGVASALAASG